jgi:hypothetical protein
MERRVLWWSAAALLMCAGSLALLALRDPITRANWDRITDGMTRPEVERLLGKPGGDFPGTPGGIPHPDWRTCQWTGRQEWIEVQFDADGFARNTHWHNQAGGQGFFADLLRRCGIRWTPPRRTAPPEERAYKELSPVAAQQPAR